MSVSTIYKKLPRGNIPIDEAWTLTDATEEEVAAAKEEYTRTNTCSHLYVTIDHGWMYDDCHCVICGYDTLI